MREKIFEAKDVVIKFNLRGHTLTAIRGASIDLYDGETLVGFVNLSDEGSEVFFGIGAHPDHCGQGYGTQMTALAWDLSQRLYPGKPMYLEVRTWNTRAVRCYEKAGFRVVGEPVKRVTHSGEGTFYHMVRQAQGSFRARC